MFVSCNQLACREAASSYDLINRLGNQCEWLYNDGSCAESLARPQAQWWRTYLHLLPEPFVIPIPLHLHWLPHLCRIMDPTIPISLPWRCHSTPNLHISIVQWRAKQLLITILNPSSKSEFNSRWDDNIIILNTNVYNFISEWSTQQKLLSIGVQIYCICISSIKRLCSWIVCMLQCCIYWSADHALCIFFFKIIIRLWRQSSEVIGYWRPAFEGWFFTLIPYYLKGESHLIVFLNQHFFAGVCSLRVLCYGHFS